MRAVNANIATSLNRFSAVILTGGSSGIGRSFLKAIYNVRQEILFCNLSRSEPERFSADLRLRHFPCDLSDRDILHETTTKVTEIVENETDSGEVPGLFM